MSGGKQGGDGEYSRPHLAYRDFFFFLFFITLSSNHLDGKSYCYKAGLYEASSYTHQKRKKKKTISK